MSPRKPASTMVLALWALGSIVVSFIAGIVLGKVYGTTTWPIYFILAVLLCVSIVGFKLLGGFERLEQARKNRGNS